MVRSDVDQIIEWNDRRGPSRLGMELVHEVQRLRHIWKSRAELSAEISNFIPMRLVTIIEVFVREVVREMVDHGQPYVDRSEKLAKGARIDFVFASNLHGQKLSIGDLVAHTISINSPTQIISYFEGLVPDFVPKLRRSHARWLEDAAAWPLPPIISDYDKTVAALARLFEVRHILTHELPREAPDTAKEIDDFLAASAEFLDATDWLVVETLKGAVPRTQLAMNMQAGETMEDLSRKMEFLMEAIASKGEVDGNMLRKSQDAWASYADAEADLRKSLVKGGSMYPMVWASAKTEAIRTRIVTLQWWLDPEEGDL